MPCLSHGKTVRSQAEEEKNAIYIWRTPSTARFSCIIHKIGIIITTINPLIDSYCYYHYFYCYCLVCHFPCRTLHRQASMMD